MTVLYNSDFTDETATQKDCSHSDLSGSQDSNSLNLGSKFLTTTSIHFYPKTYSKQTHATNF